MQPKAPQTEAATTALRQDLCKADTRTQWWRNARRLLPVVAAITGLALSLAAWGVVSFQADRQASIEFNSLAKSHASNVQNSVLGYLADIDAVRAFIESSDQGVTRNEFGHFTRRVLQEQAAIVSLSWLPRVTHDRRADHEREARDDGFENYSIKAETSNGTIVVSPPRDEYFPLYFRLEKDSGTRSAVYGLDQRYVGTVGRFLEQARMSGGLVVSEDFKLRRNGWGLFATLPVYKQNVPHNTIEERYGNLSGFVRATFDTSVMFEKIVRANPIPSGLDLYFFSDDVRPSASPPFYFASRLRSAPSQALTYAELLAGRHWSSIIEIGNRKFTMVAAPIPGGVGNQVATGAWMTLFIGLLMSAAVTAYFWFSGKHSAQLDIQNIRFDAALNNMMQGLLMFDATGHLVVCNNRYFELYGASRDVVKPGCSLHDYLDHLIDIGNIPKQDVDTYVTRVLTDVATGAHTTHVNKAANGRQILLSKVPLESGGWVTTFEDITERQETEARIAHMALHDGLTKLPNRLFFHKELDSRLAHLGRDQQCAVLFLDLDQFKPVNDTLGHPFGDKLLCQVSERLRFCLREGDMVARLGGDEFAVLQGDLRQPSDTTLLMRRLIDEMARPFDLDGHQVVIGVSIGVAMAPGDGATSDQLLKNADLALYRAKLDGRGIYRFFEPEMDARMQSRRALELDLRDAIAKSEFELHYQPLINLASDRICGFEALIRWNHPRRGMVSPAMFIPLAEETALIVPIGEWVLRRACQEAAQWPDEVSVAVNLSPAQFKAPNLAQTVISALAQSGLSPYRLELEITESALLLNNESTLATLHQLRTLGVRISMDDFGTGYSSLSYLRSFPFDKIKIDQSFVRNVPSSDDAKAIIRAVMGLGTSLRMRTTAEGVETLDELEYLKSEGCTEAQGYLLGKPRPASELTALLGAPVTKTTESDAKISERAVA